VIPNVQLARLLDEHARLRRRGYAHEHRRWRAVDAVSAGSAERNDPS